MKNCIKVLLLFCVALITTSAATASPAPMAKKPEKALSLKTPAPPKKYRPAIDGSLASSDVALYRLIFEAQEKGQMAKADRAMGKLKDRRLRGHVLYQRYMHPTAYRSKFSELKNWLDSYADYPMAERVYKLALRKGSDEQDKTLRKPKKLKKIATRTEPTMVKKQPFHHKRVSASTKSFEKKIVRLIKRRKRSSAVDVLFAADKGGAVSKAAIDYYRAKIAESYLYRGDIKVAYEMAHPAFKRSGSKVPLAGWVCGLVSWHQKDYSHAAHYFATAAESDYASGWMQSASSYWAARAHTRAGNRRAVSKWLARAQQHPRTFYGLLATVASNDKFSFDWSKPQLDLSMRKSLKDIPAAFRAMALLQIGQKELAEHELLYVNARSLEVRKSLLALASEHDLPAISIRLGSLLHKGGNRFYDSALYPDISSASHGLYKVDPALILAIARQESRFDTKARSRSGARGLMQIMPKTASYVAKKHGIAYSGVKKLNDPVYNMTLGQSYIKDLLKHPNVRDDMVSMMIAYNAGPGNLGKWRKLWSNVDDTLLFIELIPSAQTREYVERVLSNYWIYRMKQGRDLPTIETLARGREITYTIAARDLPYRIAEK